MLGVVHPGRLEVDGAQLGGHQMQAAALEPADDLAREVAFDAVGLHDDEGPFHDRRPYQERSGPPGGTARARAQPGGWAEPAAACSERSRRASATT